MSSQIRVEDLDTRRGWARLRATVFCIVGVGVFAVSAAALAMIGVAAAARAWAWWQDRSVIDAPVWSWAPGGAAVLAVAALVVSFVTAFVYFWHGAVPRVLAEIRARPLDPREHAQIHNVVEALSIGIGRPMPHLGIVDDPAPNAISLRGSGTRVLCVTIGLVDLPRDEIEAVCAHELAHLWARDSHFVTSGMVALARARRFGNAVFVLGILVAVAVGMVAYYGDTFLWGTAIIALLLLVVASASRGVLRRLELGVRRNADEIADVLAVRLAKNPESLGAVCVRLAADQRRVRAIGWRSELLWFEAVEAPEIAVEPGRPNPETMAMEIRSRSELLSRAERAYREARVQLPAAVSDALGTSLPE